ncbi:NYN domain-containing protein [Candidatus Gribaldobacteria bacterium]|nr:NYN domain-containing protein [Candidatus Gribaldobacteria bacterium]
MTFAPKAQTRLSFGQHLRILASEQIKPPQGGAVNMRQQENNFAYIDGANLHRGIAGFGWELDYLRFRVWLSEKYRVSQAYLFLGFIPKYKKLYSYLKRSGFVLVFKEVIYNDKGEPKGNCDADLVVRAMKDAYENNFEKAVIVTSDGDYASLVKFLIERKKFKTILSPHTKNLCSILLKRTGAPIAYLDDQKAILEIRKEKAPDVDKTA